MPFPTVQLIAQSVAQTVAQLTSQLVAHLGTGVEEKTTGT